MTSTTSQPSPPMFAKGELLAEKFRVERQLGAGGMGVVLEVTHIALQRRFALKLMLDRSANSVMYERFLQEARAASMLQSEHVARVTDFGALASGEPYMLMEFLEGHDLDVHLQANHPLPVSTAVDLVLQACVGLSEAHKQGIVHRDLKPANLFFTHRADGSALVKVLDFGISKLSSSEQSKGLTSTSSVIGTVLYMSPEQARSAKHVDQRADIWSLGVILHELLTRAYPFSGDTVPAYLSSMITEAADPIRKFRADLPEALEHAVLRCLEKSPEQRFQDLAGLAEALRPFASPGAGPLIDSIVRTLRGSSSAIHVSQLAETAFAPDKSEPPPERASASLPSALSTSAAEAPARGRRLVVPALLGAVGLLLAGGYALGSREQPRPPEPPASSSPSAAASSPLPSASLVRSAEAPPAPPAASSVERPAMSGNPIHSSSAPRVTAAPKGTPAGRPPPISKTATTLPGGPGADQRK